MKVDIVSSNDENFRISQKSSTSLESTSQEEQQVKNEEPVVEFLPQVLHNDSPKAVPLENPRSSRMGWFDNTSWDDGARGHRFN